MLPRSWQLVGEPHRLVFRCHFDRLTLGRLRGPALDRQPLDVLAFGESLPRPRLTQHAIGHEVGEVRAQASGRERTHRRLGTEISEHALEHVLVASDRRALQSPLTFALRQPAFDRLLERALDDHLNLRSGAELFEHRLKASLRVLRRQILGAGLWAVPSTPHHGAPRSPSAGVTNVRGTETSPSLPPLAIAPEGPEGPRATVLVELDLQVARGPFRLAHAGIDLQRLEAANELRGGRRDFPRISLEGRTCSQIGRFSWP
jgi:hypothetical protein